MKKLLFAIIFTIIFLDIVSAQTVIKMKNEGGVYTMPCEVNGLRLRFIFDTGASDVSLSLTEAVFMLKNDYLDVDDLEGSVKYSIANGDIAEGTVINLREIIIGDIVLNEIKASVIHNINAPLLLGQSALKKLGNIEFDYSNNELIINQDNLKKKRTEIDENGNYISKGDLHLYQSDYCIDSSLHYYNLALQAGDILGYYKRAKLLHWVYPNYSGKSKRKLQENILNDYEMAAKYGSTEACYFLGTIYYLGKNELDLLGLGVKQDFDYSLFYLKHAAKEGHVEGEFLLQHIAYYKLLKSERRAQRADALVAFGEGLQGNTYDTDNSSFKNIQRERKELHSDYPELIYDRITYYNKKLLELDNVIEDENEPDIKQFYAYRSQNLILQILEEMEWVCDNIN